MLNRAAYERHREGGDRKGGDKKGNAWDFAVGLRCPSDAKLVAFWLRLFGAGLESVWVKVRGVVSFGH